MFDRVGADSSFRSAPVNFSRSHPRVSPRSSDREATLRTHVRASHMRDTRHDENRSGTTRDITDGGIANSA